MDTETAPFATYEEIEVHELKLRIRSETQKLRLENHFRALADKDIRNLLLKGAVKDAVSEIRPVKYMTDVMTSGGVASQVLMGMITRRGGILKRLFSSVAAVVLPQLLGKVPWTELVGRSQKQWSEQVDPTHNGTDQPARAQRGII